MEFYTQRGGTNSLQPTEALHRPQVAHILARLGLADTITFANNSSEQLVSALQDCRWEKRASAATALGKVGTLAVITPLVSALSDDHEAVRAAAARALRYAGNAVPTSALITVLHDQDPLVREAAATTLGKIGAPAAITPLVSALSDDHEAVRAAAAQALGYGGNAVPISALVTVLDDQDPLVREAAAEALGMLGKHEARIPLLKYVQDEEALVRDAIAQALITLEQDVSRNVISILLQEKEASVQDIAGSAVTSLIDLGLNIHTEVASIAPLVVALHSMDKGVQKAVMCYLIGRALDVLQEHIPLVPLVDILHEGYQETATRQGIWNAFRSLAQQALRERKIIQLLMAATKDSDATVRKEISQAVEWLIKLALTLREERQPTESLQTVLQDSSNPEYARLHKLVQLALIALEEREAIEPLLAALSEPEAQKRVEVGKILSKRTRKALMGRIPGGPLIFSLKNASGLTPVELEFGDYEEKEGEDNRHVFPWKGSSTSQPQLSSKPELSRDISLAIAAGDFCYN